MEGCKPVKGLPLKVRTCEEGIRILFLAVESCEYWSRGITVLSPSLPPLSWMRTSTWSLSVAAASAWSRGEAAKVFKEKPSSTGGKTVAAESTDKNFLRFIFLFKH